MKAGLRKRREEQKSHVPLSIFLIEVGTAGPMPMQPIRGHFGLCTLQNSAPLDWVPALLPAPMVRKKERSVLKTASALDSPNVKAAEFWSKDFKGVINHFQCL